MLQSLTSFNTASLTVVLWNLLTLLALFSDIWELGVPYTALNFQKCQKWPAQQTQIVQNTCIPLILSVQGELKVPPRPAWYEAQAQRAVLVGSTLYSHFLELHASCVIPLGGNYRKFQPGSPRLSPEPPPPALYYSAVTHLSYSNTCCFAIAPRELNLEISWELSTAFPYL